MHRVDPVLHNVHRGCTSVAAFCIAVMVCIFFWLIKDMFDRLIAVTYSYIRANIYTILFSGLFFLVLDDLGVVCELRKTLNATNRCKN